MKWAGSFRYALSVQFSAMALSSETLNRLLGASSCVLSTIIVFWRSHAAISNPAATIPTRLRVRITSSRSGGTNAMTKHGPCRSPRRGRLPDAAAGESRHVPGGGQRTSRRAIRLLIVVELDVRLVDQGDVETEGEIAVGTLGEREPGVPATQIAVQTDEVLRELLGFEIVRRVPARGPVRRGAERHLQVHLGAARQILPDEGGLLALIR